MSQFPLLNPPIVLLGGILLIWVSLLPKTSKSNLLKLLGNSELWGALTTLFLIIARWPANSLNRYFDVDENLILAGVDRLSIHPIFWRDFDGYSSGPLNYYLPLLVKLIFGICDFITLHLLGTVLIGTALYLTVKASKNSWIAKITAAALAIIIGTAWHNTFHSYATELPSLVIIAGAAILLFQTNRTPLQNLGLGFLLALLPFAKLQGIPIGITMGLIALIQELQNKKWRNTSLLILGAILPTTVVVITAVSFGFWDEVFDRYILNNLAYTQATPGMEKARFALMEPLPLWFYTSLGIMIGLLAPYIKMGLTRKTIEALCILASAIWAAYAPGNAFIHYAFYITIPWLLLQNWTILGLPDENQTGRKFALASVAIICLFWPSQKSSIWKEPTMRRYTSTESLLLKTSLGIPDRQTLGIWGLSQNFFVDWNAVSFSRETSNGALLNQWPLAKKMREKYKEEILATPPTFYIETVGKDQFYQDRNTYGVKTWPWLENFLQEKYNIIQDSDRSRVWKLKPQK